MKIIEAKIAGLYILEPKIYEDDRGFFFESYRTEDLKKLDPEFKVQQENVSYSKRGVVRGLHFQKAPCSQAKLIRANEGCILDVVIDLRKSSRTYLEIFCIELNSRTGWSLYIPKGLAHGFAVLSEHCQISYACDAVYSQENDSGINPLDKRLNIDWKIRQDEMIISPKDLSLASYDDILSQELF